MPETLYIDLATTIKQVRNAFNEGNLIAQFNARLINTGDPLLRNRYYCNDSGGVCAIGAMIPIDFAKKLDERVLCDYYLIDSIAQEGVVKFPSAVQQDDASELQNLHDQWSDLPGSKVRCALFIEYLEKLELKYA